MEHEPKIFIFNRYANNGVRPIDAEISHADPCPSCDKFQTVEIRRLHVQIRKPPKVWYPFIYFNTQGIAAHLIRADVFDLILSVPITGVERGPEVLITPKRSGPMEHPPYFVARFRRTLKLDVRQGDPHGSTYSCSRCGMSGYRDLMPPRLIPIWKTWDKSDLFQLKRPYVSDSTLYCSRRFIDLARAERWRHLRFYSIDRYGPVRTGSCFANSQDVLRIDHLARKWPPNPWHTPSYADERTPRLWLEMYNSFPERDYRLIVPWFALMDRAEEALPLIIDQFFSLDEEARIRAARMIDAIARYQHAPVPDDLAMKAWKTIPSMQRNERPPVAKP